MRRGGGVLQAGGSGYGCRQPTDPPQPTYNTPWHTGHLRFEADGSL